MMNPVLARALSLLIGYICGNFLMGYFLAKKAEVDIKHSGSGNVGFTNATRVMGKKVGVITLISDIAKGFVAGGIVWLIFHSGYDGNIHVLLSYAGMGAFFGHIFPFYMNFSGGKGIAVSLAFMCLSAPQVVPLGVAVFLLIAVTTRYISLGSILGTIVVVIEVFIFGHMGWLWYSGAELTEVEIIFVICAATAIIKHRENIGRLVRGEESKFGSSAKAEKSGAEQ